MDMSDNIVTFPGFSPKRGRSNTSGCELTPSACCVYAESNFRYTQETSCTGNNCRKKEIEKTIMRILGWCAFSHSLGHFQTSDRVRARSVHPPIADIRRLRQQVRKVPEPDSCTAANGALTVTMIDSVTSSARTRSDSAIIRSIAFAVFRLAGEQRQTLG